MKELDPNQLEAIAPGYLALQRSLIRKMFAAGKPRWRVIEKHYSFLIACERERCHIEITYGTDHHNIPLFGSKDEARLDANTICTALNKRDDASIAKIALEHAAPKPQVPGGE